MAADDGQLKLRIPQSLKTIIEQRAEDNHRTINGEVIFLLEQAISNTSKADVKVINLNNDYKRLVYGKLLNVIDVDYTQDLSKLRDDIELSLKALREASFIQKIAFINKEVIVYQGGRHIDIVNHGKGSLGWLRVEDHYVKDGLEPEESN